MSQLIDWEVVKEEFISGADRHMLAATIGISEPELMSAAERNGWLAEAIMQKKQRVQERAALGSAESLDEAVHEDDMVLQAVTQNFKNVIYKVSTMMGSVSSPSQLRHLVTANIAAYEGYKDLRGLSDSGSSDDDLAALVREAQQRNRALANDAMRRLEYTGSN